MRVVGEIKIDKLESLKRANAIAKEKLAEHRPDQYFAAILDNVEKHQHLQCKRIQELAARFLHVPSRHISIKIFQDKATAIKGGMRHYGEIAAIKAQTINRRVHKPSIEKLIALQTKIITKELSESFGMKMFLKRGELHKS